MNPPLDTHPLIAEVSNVYWIAFNSATTRKGRDVEWIRDLSVDEDYARRVFFSATAVTDNLNQIKQAGLFLSGFRTSARLKAHGVTRLDHIVYHIENFFLRTTGCLDRCLVLVNDAMDLGLEPEDCSYRLVRSISHVRRSPVQGVLGQINAVVKPYKDQRNLVAHREKHTDSELRDVELFNFVLKHEPDDLKYHHFKFRADQYVAAKQGEIERVAASLDVVCKRLFDKLKPGVDKKLSALKPAV